MVNSTKKETTEVKKPTEIPKYLEIICDNSYLTHFSDGYEIPRSSVKKNKKTDSHRKRTFSNSSTLSSDSNVSTAKLNKSDVNNVQRPVVQKT